MKKQEFADKNKVTVLQQNKLGDPIAGLIQNNKFKDYNLNQPESMCNCLKSKNSRIKLLENENHRLKMIVEDLMLDKLTQAQRIKELEHEKSLIKNIIAEITLDQQILKKAL